MWLLTILLQGEATPTILQFKEEKEALEQFEGIFLMPVAGHEWKPSQLVSLVYDFGLTLSFQRNLFAKALLQSLERAMAGDRQVNLMGSVSQAMLELEVYGHPKIKELQHKRQMLQQPTGIVAPAFGGFGGQRFG